MRIILFVGLGSFIGGVARYLLSLLIQNRVLTTFPYGTLCVNILGCFLIGIVFGAAERSGFSNELRLFLMTGVLGGFTTFSAFSLESLALLKAGQTGPALIYVATSVVIGLLATWAGIFAGQYTH